MKKNIIIAILVLISNIIVAQTSDSTTGTNEIRKIEVSVPVEEKVYKIEESNLEKEITLNGQDVLISGNDNKITIKALIGKITITGKDKDDVIESVNQIVITGNGNFVSWEKTSNGNQKPNILDKGGYNNVGRKSGNALDKADDQLIRKFDRI